MDYVIRAAELVDAPVIVEHRRAMFADMGHRDEAALTAMSRDFEPWLRRKMASGEYMAWFAEADTGVVAGAGVWLMDWPPHISGGSAPRANLLNVYTAPEWRRRGVARELVNIAIAWCRERGVAIVILHASEEGRPLYEALGFVRTNEMRLMLASTPRREK